MEKPLCPQNAPYIEDVKAGRKYWWCSCGQSKKQPYCDGSHKGTEFSPVMYECDKDGRAFFCGCKKSRRQPICDGSHNR